MIQRDNNREAIFVVEKGYQFYLAKLKDDRRKCQSDLHVYEMMANDVQLVITLHIENGISKIMQLLL